jgi:hypothetical protein
MNVDSSAGVARLAVVHVYTQYGPFNRFYQCLHLGR